MPKIDVVMEVDKKLYEEIKEYCSLNGLKPRDFTNSLLKKAFMEEKYGKAPPFFTQPALDIVENKPMNMPEPPKAENRPDIIIPEKKSPTESRHDVAESVAKEEKTVKNDDFPDKIETIEPKQAYKEENQPIETVQPQKIEEKPKTIKKRKL